MNIAVIGTGYVGIVTGTCLANAGHRVTCIDKDRSKIAALRSGVIPIYEPGLDEMVVRNVAARTLHFGDDLASGIADAEVVFLAVGTPQGEDGSADLSGIWAAGTEVARALNGPKTVVIKSTVPVGTNAELSRRMAEITDVPFEVASNPEFLKEGSAIADFAEPDRVVIGIRSAQAEETLRRLYDPFVAPGHPLLVMTPESAEMTKYAANCLLATKISFINEMANLCERVGADVQDVRLGMGHDRRLGFHFLSPGVGYGGSCFPKDIRAAISMARAAGLPARVLEAVDEVNLAQKERLGRAILDHFGGQARGRVVTIWGLSFKPETDDIRESPALPLIDALLEAGVFVRVHDPVSTPNVRALYGDRLVYCRGRYEATEGADVLAIVTDWRDYRSPNLTLVRDLMRGRAVFDGRNILDPSLVASAGLGYWGIGRAEVRPAPAPQASNELPRATHAA